MNCEGRVELLVRFVHIFSERMAKTQRDTALLACYANTVLLNFSGRRNRYLIGNENTLVELARERDKILESKECEKDE